MTVSRPSLGLGIDLARPWDDPAWDAYVNAHPGATAYHTSTWISIIRDVGQYEPLCLVARDGDRVCGVLPMMLVRSLITGNRIVCLPFSDVCYPLADHAEASRALIARALDLATQHKVRYLELRGEARHRDDSGQDMESLGFGTQNHFNNYVTPLCADTDAVRKTFSRTAVRQTISKSARLGCTTLRTVGLERLDDFYTMYAMNRKRHGIPPQPKRLFALILSRMTDHPGASLYIVEHEEKTVAGLINLHYKGTTYAKYEGVDETARHALPIYALFWSAIEDSARDGDTTFDWGRTAMDNPGLNGFKSRWGTTLDTLPYFFNPPSDGLSVVKSDSWKYRMFTAVVRRMPLPVATRLGARIFRHFG